MKAVKNYISQGTINLIYVTYEYTTLSCFYSFFHIHSYGSLFLVYVHFTDAKLFSFTGSLFFYFLKWKIFHKAIYRFIANKISMLLFTEIEKKNIKFTWNHKRTKSIKAILCLLCSVFPVFSMSAFK